MAAARSSDSPEPSSASSAAAEASCEHGEVERPTSPYPEAAIERAASLFRACGEPARLRMLERMIGREVCVSELAAFENEAMSTVSQRLRLLRADGLVARRRDGRHVFYSLADSHVAELVRNALDHAAEDC